MSKKNIIKITLDIIMAVLFITFFKKNLISMKFHMISGLVFGAFIIIHMILNRKWIVSITKRLFDKKIKIRIKISYILSFILLISIILILVSGIFIIKAQTYDRVMFWKMLHFGSSYISLALVGIHIGLYLDWVINIFKKIFKVNKSNKVVRMMMNLVVIVILVFGLYTMNKQQYFQKSINCIKYTIEHFVPQDLEEGNNNYKKYKQEKPSFIEVVSIYGSILSVFAIGTYYSDKALKRVK